MVAGPRPYRWVAANRLLIADDVPSWNFRKGVGLVIHPFLISYSVHVYSPNLSGFDSAL
jgi:hypothetical protein